MAILTRTGRTLFAKTIAQTDIYLAWGRGDANWQEPTPESISAAHLQAVIGYRKAKKVAFCEPDDTGDIMVQGGRFSQTTEPTQYLYCQFTFDFLDAAGETIREVGLMSGTVAHHSVPEGQVYLTPEQVDEPGTLLLLEHRAPLIREQGVRESFEFVISF